MGVASYYMKGELCIFQGDDEAGDFYGMLVAMGFQIQVYRELQKLKDAIGLHRQLLILMEVKTWIQYCEVLDLWESDGGVQNQVRVVCSRGGEWADVRDCCPFPVIDPQHGMIQLLSKSGSGENHAPFGEIRAVPDFGELNAFIGVSEARNTLLSQISRYASCDVPLLFTGEAGVGKSFLAELTASVYGLKKKIRYAKAGINHISVPFVHCPVVTYSVETMESTLFGHVKGSFTGAVSDRTGKIAAAEQGTLFLDEVGDIPLCIQAKLLQFLQNKTYCKMGSNRVETSDARIISATNKDLSAALSEGSIRRDFLERIAGKILHIPGLNERMEDIPVLAQYFLQKTNEKWGTCNVLSDTAMYRLLEINWSNRNTRALENLVKRMIVESDSTEMDGYLVENCLQVRF